MKKKASGMHQIFLMEKISNDNLFVSDQHLPVFETQKLADFFGTRGGLQATLSSDKDLIKTLLKVAAKEYKIKVFFSNPGDIILKIEEVIVKSSENIFWHVVIGDKFGWIVWKRDYIKRVE